MFRRIILCVLTLMFSVIGLNQVEAGTHYECNTSVLIKQLIYKDPAHFVFMNTKEDLWEAYEPTCDNRDIATAFLRYVPENVEIATFTVFRDTAETMIEMIEMADRLQKDNCRWVYAQVKPVILFILRKPNGRVETYDWINPDEDWHESLARMLILNELMPELKFEVRPVYQVCFSKLNWKSPIHKMVDFNDGTVSLQSMMKTALGVSSGYSNEDYFNDYYANHPWEASKSWKEEYNRMLHENRYYEVMRQIEKYYN